MKWIKLDILNSQYPLKGQQVFLMQKLDNKNKVIKYAFASLKHITPDNKFYWDFGTIKQLIPNSKGHLIEDIQNIEYPEFYPTHYIIPTP